MKTLARFVFATLILASVSVQPAVGQAGGPPLIDLDFRGGTVGDYVSALRRQAPSVNIVVVSDASRVALPAFELRSVDLMGAVNLLRTIDEQRGDRSVVLDVAITSPGTPGAASVYTIRAAERGRRTAPPRQSIVLSLEDVLGDGVAAEDLLTAVETAMELLSDEMEMTPAQIRFHEATGILIARGHPDQVSMIEGLIDQLRRNVRIRQEVDQREADRQDELRAIEADFVNRLRLMQDRLEMQQKENVRLQDELALQRQIVEQLRSQTRSGGGDG